MTPNAIKISDILHQYLIPNGVEFSLRKIDQSSETLIFIVELSADC